MSIVPDPIRFPRLVMPMFAAVAGATALGAVALYRRLTRKTADAVVTSARGDLPRATVVVESDGPVREATDVPW